MSTRTRDEQSKPFEFKSGFGGFAWGGMLTDGDPSSNPPNRPRMLVNCRFSGGELRERAGLTKVLAAPVLTGACIRHLMDFQVRTPRKLWLVVDGCPGISSSVGWSVAHFDQEQEPEFQRAVYYNALTTSLILASFGGVMHIGADDTLRKLELLSSRWGSGENLALSGSSQDLPLVPPWTGYIIRAMLEFDGKLFISLDAGAGASKIVVWDGVSWANDLTAINPVTCFARFRVSNGGDAIVACFGGGTNHVRIRPTGPAGTAWTTVAPGAGTLDARQAVSYKDVLYIADLNGSVWSFTGTVLAIARTPAGSTSCPSVGVFNGYLFFGYQTAATVPLGRFDGSSWVDVHKDMKVQFATATSVRAIAGYRNSLYLGGVKGATGSYIWVSPGTSTSGTYDEVIPAGTANGDFDSFVVL